MAVSLGYADPKKAIQEHIDPEDKMAIEELLGSGYKMILQQSFSTGEKNSPVEFFQNLRRNQKIINEFAIYSLCMKSRLRRIKPFQRWIYSTIKEIRITGSYTLPHNLSIDNPLDLVTKIEILERETESLKKGIKVTCNNETQTRQSTKDVRDSFRKLKTKIERSIEKVEFELKKSLKETSSSSSYSSSPRHSSSDEY